MVVRSYSFKSIFTFCDEKKSMNALIFTHQDVQYSFCCKTLWPAWNRLFWDSPIFNEGTIASSIIKFHWVLYVRNTSYPSNIVSHIFSQKRRWLLKVGVNALAFWINALIWQWLYYASIEMFCIQTNGLCTVDKSLIGWTYTTQSMYLKNIVKFFLHHQPTIIFLFNSSRLNCSSLSRVCSHDLLGSACCV
jgi:hypothetical protein